VFSGICACSPQLLDEVPHRGDLPRDVFPGLAERGLLRAQPLAGYRCAVDSVERLEQARADVAAGKVTLA
jgi:mannose-1-phosphate guanylyltransferase/phosphomannomutase